MDACFEPVHEFDEVLSHPQFLYREIFQEVDHPVEGKIKQIGFPIKFSETPGKIRTPPPLHGEHIEMILRSIGYSQSNIEKLRERKVI
jgi:crotonobetainyl-CoA:carnitine CoA-transferase CaiB-like acyl-CoA transferase